MERDDLVHRVSWVAERADTTRRTSNGKGERITFAPARVPGWFWATSSAVEEERKKHREQRALRKDGNRPGADEQLRPVPLFRVVEPGELFETASPVVPAGARDQPVRVFALRVLAAELDVANNLTRARIDVAITSEVERAYLESIAFPRGTEPFFHGPPGHVATVRAGSSKRYEAEQRDPDKRDPWSRVQHTNEDYRQYAMHVLGMSPEELQNGEEDPRVISDRMRAENHLFFGKRRKERTEVGSERVYSDEADVRQQRRWR